MAPLSHSSKSPKSSISLVCRHHSPSETLDILLLLSLLFSSLYLLFSFLSHLLTSLSLLHPLLPIALSLIPFISLVFSPKHKCPSAKCKGLKNASEFDLRVQSEEVIRERNEGVREVDNLPWKGGSEGNLDYEVLRVELRKMAPVNGRAVLVFRAKCGCPVAKLEGWNGKRNNRKHKKGLALSGGDKC